MDEQCIPKGLIVINITNKNTINRNKAFIIIHKKYNRRVNVSSNAAKLLGEFVSLQYSPEENCYYFVKSVRNTAKIVKHGNNYVICNVTIANTLIDNSKELTIYKVEPIIINGAETAYFKLIKVENNK